MNEIKEENKESIDKQPKEDFFKGVNLSTILPKRVLDMNELLDFIKKNSPVSAWKISKELNLPTSSLYYKLRDMEFSGLIFSRIVVNEHNRTERIIYSTKPKEEEK